jgi:hypothetical protein
MPVALLALWRVLRQMQYLAVVVDALGPLLLKASQRLYLHLVILLL